MNTTTLIENILVKEKDGKSAYEKFYNRNPSFVKYLHKFGEVDVVAYADRKMRPKFTNRGRVRMFMGYTSAYEKLPHFSKEFWMKIYL